MLRNLLTDRFKLTFHREQRVFSIYELEVAKNGPKLKASTAPPDDPPALISTVFPQRIVMPARNVTMSDLARLTQFGGEVPAASAEAQAAPLFSAIQQQLGLKLEATRGPVAALVVDKAERPSAN